MGHGALMDTYPKMHPLKAARKARGVSRCELAARLGRSIWAVGAYERGEKSPPPEIIEALIQWSDGELSLSDFVRSERRLLGSAAHQPSNHPGSAGAQAPGEER